MFIHFGLATFSQDEFADRQADINLYAPTDLNPDQWIEVAAEAGMKYAVLTARHQQGHCLWPSRFTDFTVVNSPNTRDVVAEFVTSCRARGIQPGLYYLLGWELKHQSQLAPHSYANFLAHQIEELLTTYGPIFVMWFDIPFDLGPDSQAILQRLYDLVKEIQPDCLVMLNSSEWDGCSIRRRQSSYNFKEIDGPLVDIWPADLINGERTPPAESGHKPNVAYNGQTYYLPMETCDTLSKYWFHIDGDTLKTTEQLLELFQSTVGRGGNLLLDVPPDRSGRISEESRQALLNLKRAIGSAL